MKSFNSKNNSGFTMIETLVAITILIIGVLGPLALAARGISDGLFAQNQLTANMLAQEAIETIVNQHNTNVVQSVYAFKDIIPDRQTSPYTVSNISVDGSSGSIKPDSDCAAAIGCKLFIDPADGLYKKSTDGTGLFSRKITATLLNNEELRVDVLIGWKNKTVDKYFATAVYLYAD